MLEKRHLKSSAHWSLRNEVGYPITSYSVSEVCLLPLPRLMGCNIWFLLGIFPPHYSVLNSIAAEFFPSLLLFLNSAVKNMHTPTQNNRKSSVTCCWIIILNFLFHTKTTPNVVTVKPDIQPTKSLSGCWKCFIFKAPHFLCGVASVMCVNYSICFFLSISEAYRLFCPYYEHNSF